MKQVKYKVLQDDKETIKTVIHKTGYRKVDVTFTLKDLVDEIKAIKSEIVKHKSEASVHMAEMKNVEKNYPTIKTIPEATMKAVYVYVDAKINHARSKENEDRLEKDLNLDLKELSKICAELNLPEPII